MRKFIILVLVLIALCLSHSYAVAQQAKKKPDISEDIRSLDTQVIELRVEISDLKLQMMELRETLLRLMDIQPSAKDSTKKETK